MKYIFLSQFNKYGTNLFIWRHFVTETVILVLNIQPPAGADHLSGYIAAHV